MSSTKHYTIKITGSTSTSPGPYTIYYGIVNPPSTTNIPPIYPVGLPPVLAQNLSLSTLTGGTGVTVEVPENTTVIYLYNKLCPDNTISLIPETSTPMLNFRVMTENNPITTFPVSINQPTCICDGSILFNPTLDNPPFTYSINNGVTYSNSPIFSKLCSGIYNLSILDSLNNRYDKTITLEKPTESVTYTLYLNTIPSTQINNTTTISKSYETTILVTPEIPDGATIYFDLVHNNSFYSGPLSGTSILSTGTLLYKNEITIPLSTTINENATSINSSPGCQSTTIYQYNVSEYWNMLELTNKDKITLSTSTRVDKLTLSTCTVGYSTDTYSIANARIVGCDCCSILINT